MKQQANLIRAGQVIEHEGRRWTVLKQQIITPGGRCSKINCGINTLVGQSSIKLQFHITRSFEFLKDHLVHFTARINQGRSNDS